MGLLRKFKARQLNGLGQESQIILFSRIGKLDGGLQLSISKACISLFYRSLKSGLKALSVTRHLI